MVAGAIWVDKEGVRKREKEKMPNKNIVGQRKRGGREGMKRRGLIPWPSLAFSCSSLSHMTPHCHLLE